jgi:hypothetical protein
MNTMRDLMLVLAAVSGCMNIDAGEDNLSGLSDINDHDGPGIIGANLSGYSDVSDGATSPGMDGEGLAPKLWPHVPGPKPQPCHDEPQEPMCMNVPWQEAVGMLAQGYCDRCEFGVEGCYERVFAELQPNAGDPEPLPVCLSDWADCEAQMDANLVVDPDTGTCGYYEPLTECADMFVMP